MKIIIFLIYLLLVLGCHHEPEPLRLDGTYTGTFQRGKSNPVPITITFSGNRYRGNSGNTLTNGVYPAICEGKFRVLSGVIYFENECFFTANFDWSLILSQEWQVKSIGNQLLLDRNNDRYVLAR